MVGAQSGPFKASILSAGAILVADLINSYFQQKWGIYDDAGNLVLEPDSFIGMDFANNWQISDYPVEQGSFATYNKVATPYSSTVSMAKGGSEADRTAFLTTLDTIAGGLTLYTITTPEKNYINATIERYDYERRTHRGAGCSSSVHQHAIRRANSIDRDGRSKDELDHIDRCCVN
ncbi:MAG: hypothetical protein B7Y20_14955 [Acidovorax sp. 16-64-162]|nr:MAG: hypothetical protein B7Y20_14955 [Acidovorax sp. 16-64-162]